ncbi:MAG: molybdate ABC transporter permease subunit [Sneathiella sp.]|nr:molybdate ABC transporter permease subunit [Sneathiella sp.]
MSISPAEIEVILLSLKVALWCVAISLVPALFIGWLLARREFYGKTALTVIVHLPIFLPPVVVGYFLLVTLGNRGLIGGWLNEQFGISLIFNWKGVVAATAVMAFPFISRAIRQAFEAVDRNLEMAALTLGRSPLMVFLTITLPLIAPGILAGATLGFAKALGEFGATITFVANVPGQTQTLPLAIFSLMETPNAESALWRLVIISVLLAFAAIALSEWLTRRSIRKLGGRA